MDTSSHTTPGNAWLAEASAPAKLILCGEHAVVYGAAAIALPLSDMRARVQVAPAPAGSGMHLHAPDLSESWTLAERPDHPLSELVSAALRQMQVLGPEPPDLELTIRSAIPVAGGLGSGAAVATALVRALAGAQGVVLPPDDVAALVYLSEQRYHGTPSGIDNTVIAHEQAIWYERQQDGQPEPAVVRQAAQVPGAQRRPRSDILIEPVEIGDALTLVIGDTGIRSETRLPVGEVRRRWESDQQNYQYLFNRVDYVVRQVRIALASGDTTTLGLMLNENQELLEEMGVSSPELNALVAAAQQAGALGAKLSGGGWGGVMLALAYDAEHAAEIATALLRAGATEARVTQVVEASI
jgi:mevalonate kinase